MSEVDTVLIETLWNVKTSSSGRSPGRRICINRNIVECKGICWRDLAVKASGINRNIVECKVEKNKALAAVINPY